MTSPADTPSEEQALDAVLTTHMQEMRQVVGEALDVETGLRNLNGSTGSHQSS
ncbi:hypothetical protein [Streptomyces sp. NPDC054838]